ncbi:hypothetical protein Aasi_1297 [Candidatus Amoebophilus asiaticus 5a2]|uniref:Lipoprotein n=1 Tax=Amoebophilus asiaticus (strain 5a2) TaxID=452471 RepID=B3ETQ9_AMOA5|nr:hypothetical protein [Candidatus Amoebophilus asiaticus]ACE06611.1 hypothetical protein Aasi_1297 [Candidatus Amoebophilus asiaticus 5a2]
MNFNSFQRFVARILLVSLCLQSCGGGFDNNPFIPTCEKQPAHITTHTQEIIDQTSIHPLVDQTLTAQGGHAVTFYKYKGELQASVEVVDEKDKVYNGVPVEVKQGIDVASLIHLPKKIQQNRIYIQLAKGNQPAKVMVYKRAGLMGGGNMFTRPLEEQNVKPKEQEEVNLRQEIGHKEMDITDLIVQLSFGTAEPIYEKDATESFSTNEIHHFQNLSEPHQEVQTGTENTELTSRKNQEKGKEKLKDDEGNITEQTQVSNPQQGQAAKIYSKNGRKKRQRQKQRLKVNKSTDKKTEQTPQQHLEIENKEKQGKIETVHSATSENCQDLVQFPIGEKKMRVHR